MILFKHSGDIGDMLFSLHFVKDWCREMGSDFTDGASLMIHFGSTCHRAEPHPNGSLQMTEQTAKFIYPFMKHCGLFEDVYIASDEEWKRFEPKASVMDLDNFRKLPLTFMTGDLRLPYYQLTNRHIEPNFTEDLFASRFTGDSRARDRVIMIFTERYNPLNLDHATTLKPWLDRLLFVGLPREHVRFCRDILNVAPEKVEFFPVKDLEDVAYLMKGAHGVIGNQSGLYSLAEMLKVPRVLLSPEWVKMNGRTTVGPANNIPMGGWCERVSWNGKYAPAVKCLMDRK